MKKLLVLSSILLFVSADVNAGIMDKLKNSKIGQKFQQSKLGQKLSKSKVMGALAAAVGKELDSQIQSELSKYNISFGQDLSDKLGKLMVEHSGTNIANFANLYTQMLKGITEVENSSTKGDSVKQKALEGLAMTKIKLATTVEALTDEEKNIIDELIYAEITSDENSDTVANDCVDNVVPFITQYIEDKITSFTNNGSEIDRTLIDNQNTEEADQEEAE